MTKERLRFAEAAEREAEATLERANRAVERAERTRVRVEREFKDAVEAEKSALREQAAGEKALRRRPPTASVCQRSYASGAARQPAATFEPWPPS